MLKFDNMIDKTILQPQEYHENINFRWCFSKFFQSAQTNCYGLDSTTQPFAQSTAFISLKSNKNQSDFICDTICMDIYVPSIQHFYLILNKIMLKSVLGTFLSLFIKVFHWLIMLIIVSELTKTFVVDRNSIYTYSVLKRWVIVAVLSVSK